MSYLRFRADDGSEFPDWEEKILGIICEINTGKPIDKTKFSNDKDLKFNYPIFNGGTKITGYYSSYNKENGVCISRVGTAGYVQLIREKIWSGDSNIFINSYNTDIKYVYCYLKQNETKITNQAQVGVMPNIKLTYIRNMIIKLPSLLEQEKIAEFLSLLDERIEKQEELLNLLKEEKKSYSQKIFNQELRFKNDDGTDYPEWEEKIIKEMFEISRGVVIAKSKVSANKSGNNKYPIYSSQTSNKGLMGWNDKPLLSGKKITWTTDGAYAGTVFLRDGQYSCTNVCGILTPKEKYNGYANHLIVELLNSITKNHVNYVGNPKLMSNVMGNIKLNTPSLPEQEKIAEFLGALDENIELQEKLLEKYRQEKKSYLQKMIIPVNDNTTAKEENDD